METINNIFKELVQMDGKTGSRKYSKSGGNAISYKESEVVESSNHPKDTIHRKRRSRYLFSLKESSIDDNIGKHFF